MRIISFAWTTPSLLAGHKTVTRRNWRPDYAAQFRAGDLVQAYNRSPRHRGEHVATIRIDSITYECESTMPDEDYAGEGFAYLNDHPDLLPKSGPFSDPSNVTWEEFEDWRTYSYDWVSVIRFTIVELTERGREIRASLPDVVPIEAVPDA